MILSLVLVWLAYRYNTKPEEVNPYYSEFNKLISKGSNEKLLTLGSIKIEPNQVGKDVRLGNYVFKVKLVEVNTVYETSSTVLSPAFHYKDNTRNITVYIEYKGNIYTIEMNGDLNNYRNLYTSNLKIDDVSTQYHNIFYLLSVKQIYVHNQTEDWYGLVLNLNRLVETNDDKIPLYKDAFIQPTRTNLLNPENDMLYDNNYHAYRTPYRDKVDNYGVIFKKNKDNIQRTVDVIRKTIESDNSRKAYSHEGFLKDGESKTIIH